MVLLSVAHSPGSVEGNCGPCYWDCAYQAQVLDLTGRVLLTRTLAGGQAQPLDVHTLPAGAYLVVLTGAGTRQTLPLLRN